MVQLFSDSITIISPNRLIISSTTTLCLDHRISYAGIINAPHVQGMVDLAEQEAWGLELFEGEAMCSKCHITSDEPPLFTGSSFDNLGVPKNPENPFYDMDTVFLDDGSPINPLGSDCTLRS